MTRIFRDLIFLSVGVTATSMRILASDSSVTLRSRYGKPVSETFTVRPGVGATATYDLKGRITEWVISPLNTDLIKTRSKGLNTEDVKTLLDELVPPRERGKPVSSSILNMTCLPENDCGGSEQTFQHVTIYYNQKYVVVQWRR